MRHAEQLELPATPAHVAWLTSEGAWAFPMWLQYVNERITEFLLRPGQHFMAIEVPVRFGKSWHISRFTPAWYLGMFPTHQVLLTSYSSSLSSGFGRDTRDLFDNHGERLFGQKVRWDARSNRDWKLESGGGMRAVARGGTIIGTGGNLIIIDDPFKDFVEAEHRKTRDEVYEWYQRTLRGRLEPDGKMICVMSRWHQDDLLGRLTDTPNYDGDAWEVIHLPAIAEPGEGVEDREAWRDAIGRRAGESLWPERFSVEQLAKIRAAVGPNAWNSQYQQVPVTPGGEMFPRTKWGGVNAVSRSLDIVCRIDLAASERASADFSAMSTIGRDRKGFTFVLDVRKVRAESNAVMNWVRTSADELSARFGNIHFVIEQEPGSGGKQVAEMYVRDVLGQYSAEKKTTSRDKVINATALAGQVQAGNAFLLREVNEHGQMVAAPWWSDFLDEAAEFPRGAHDDTIDTASQAYNDLLERARGRKRSKGTIRRPKGNI